MQNTDEGQCLKTDNNKQYPENGGYFPAALNHLT